jgi:hypothetical protein
MTRLAGFLLGGGYFATIWYAMESGYVRRTGIELDEYGMLAAVIGLGWIVLGAAGDLAARIIAKDAKGLGKLNGLTLGALAMLALLPLHLLYGPRHQTGTPFALNELTMLAIVALVWLVALDLSRAALRRLSRRQDPPWFVVGGLAALGFLVVLVLLAISIAESEGSSIAEGFETPAEAITVGFGMCLAAGAILSLVIDLPRALWLRARAPAAPTENPAGTGGREGSSIRQQNAAAANDGNRGKQERPRAMTVTAPTVVRR